VKELGSQGEKTYNLTDASVSDLSSWLEEVNYKKKQKKNILFCIRDHCPPYLFFVVVFFWGGGTPLLFRSTVLF
jgi:hypothetical protein